MQTTGRVNFEKNNQKTKKIRVIDIQYCLKVLNLNTPNIIKVDVEGHEYEVLSSILLNINNLL